MKQLDQFYTHPEVAARFVASLADRYDLGGMEVLEPSAGEGAFFFPLRELGLSVRGIDLEPRAPGIVQGDFLLSAHWPECDRIAVVGNPPFGFASSMAIRFFNKAAEHASLIAFIVPRTFRKISVADKLNRNFWLAHDEDVPSHSFLLNGKPHDVPCAWQVWEYRTRRRPVCETPDVSRIIRYTNQRAADFAVRRVGGRAGAVLPLSKGPYSEQSTYFINAVRPDAEELMAGINWNTVRNSTAGVRSVSKREIAIELSRRV